MLRKSVSTMITNFSVLGVKRTPRRLLYRPDLSPMFFFCNVVDPSGGQTMEMESFVR